MQNTQYEPLVQALFRATDYGVLMTNLEGTDILCNPRFGVLFDMNVKKVIHLPRAEMRRIALTRVKDTARFIETLEHAYTDPWLEFEDEIELVAPRESILRRHSGPVLDAQGGVLGRIWTFLDVTETRRLQAEVASHAKRLEARLEQQAMELQAAQQKLLETEQMRAVGVLAMGIAHDLRNILTTLRLEMAMPEAAPCQAAVNTQFDRLYALTHSLLALSDETHIPSCSVDVSEVIDFVFRLAQGQAEIDGVHLFKQVESDVPPVFGNPRRLEHLFVNLLLNALNAVAPTGGTVTVGVRQDAGRVRVDVRDTGPGIPPEHQPHVFEPFFTTRANRTGLGLFSARRIVEAHGGEITVESEAGRDTCVSVWLPAVEISSVWLSMEKV